MYVDLLNEHRKTQGVERKKLAKHREKCYKRPEKYLGICIDGMDQKKTELPHFLRCPKNMDEKYFIPILEPVRDVSNRQCVVLWLQNLFQKPNITNTDGIVKDIPVGISPCMLRRLNIHRQNVCSPIVLLYCSLNKILERKWNVGCRNLFLRNLIHFIPNHWPPLALGDKFKLQTTCPIIRKHSQSRYRYRVSHSRFIQE